MMKELFHTHRQKPDTSDDRVWGLTREERESLAPPDASMNLSDYLPARRVLRYRKNADGVYSAS